MAFTREFIRNLAKESGIEMPKEFEDGLVTEHISARDTYAENEVKKAVKANEPKPVKESEEYLELQKEFETYKNGVEEKNTKATKREAVKGMLKEIGVSEKRLDAILRIYDFDNVELDEKGKIKDIEKRKEKETEEWGDYIEKIEKKPMNPSTPPDPKNIKMTRDDILKIEDDSERRQAIAQNLELFD